MNNKDLMKNELIEILAESGGSVIDRENCMFDRLSGGKGNPLVLFGAGILGKKVLAGLRKRGISPLLFCDNDPKKWGKYIDGLMVLSPQEAVKRYGQTAVFVITIFSHMHSYHDVKIQLERIGCRYVSPFIAVACKYPDLFLPYYYLDMPHKILEQSEKVYKAFSLLSDKKSRINYLNQLKWRFLLNVQGLSELTQNEQYFDSDIVVLKNDDVFVDCGAYDGDTVKKYLQCAGNEFKKIYAFEPDSKNYSRLKKYISKLPYKNRRKINVSKCAVGENSGQSMFGGHGSLDSSMNQSGKHKVKVVSLDEKLIGEDITFIKLDIEGAEYDALLGAEKIIAKKKPIIAVCVYHRQDDLWKIPIFIDSIMPNYRYYLRQYEEDGFGLILYAVPIK